MTEEIVESSLQKLLEYVEILHAAEDALQGTRTSQGVLDIVQKTLEEFFSSAPIALSEFPEGNAENRWAHQHPRALILPSSGGGSRIIFPLRGEPGLRSFTAKTSLDPEAATRIANQVVDRFVRMVEHTLKTLREQKQEWDFHLLLDGIIDSLRAGILATDTSGRVIVANSTTEVLFQVQRIDLLDEPVGKLPIPIAETLKTLFTAVMKDGRVHERQFEYVLDRGVMHLGITGSPLGLQENEMAGVIFICRDLSLGMELQKLRQLDTMKTEFVHTVSHELKTPLTAILGCVELLKLDEKNLNKDHRELVDLMDQGARRLQTLIQDILSLSRLEEGMVELDRSMVDLSVLLDEVTARLPMHDRDRIHIHTAKTLPEISADAPKVQQVLENLISNALKYSDTDSPVKVTLRSQGKLVVVNVIDEGMGIRPQDRKHVFEKFFRSEDARLAGKEGTGLGLSITNEIVRLHGGRLTFKSRRGKGTTFTLELPVG